MTIEITEQQAEIIRQGLVKLQEYTAETFKGFDAQIVKQLTEKKLKETGVENAKS